MAYRMSSGSKADMGSARMECLLHPKNEHLPAVPEMPSRDVLSFRASLSAALSATAGFGLGPGRRKHSILQHEVEAGVDHRNPTMPSAYATCRPPERLVTSPHSVRQISVSQLQGWSPRCGDRT